MIVKKNRNGYNIILNLSIKKNNKKSEFRITVDNEFGINIPATGDLNPNQIEILLDGIVMANSLKKKEIIFKNER